MKKQLDKKAVWFFFLQNMIGYFFVFVFIGGWLLMMFMSLLFGNTNIDFSSIAIMFFSFTVFCMFVIVPVISYIVAVLSYKNYTYELTEDCFRKEHGIIWKKYVSIPYGRIQNVDIYRGVFARMLGLSDLNIQTAGASVQNTAGEGRLPAISALEAEALRDELIKRTKVQSVGL
jgi:uncharacterized protein